MAVQYRSLPMAALPLAFPPSLVYLATGDAPLAAMTMVGLAGLVAVYLALVLGGATVRRRLAARS